jgi:predicted negative regulator of RcsB-dependent stress response
MIRKFLLLLLLASLASLALGPLEADTLIHLRGEKAEVLEGSVEKEDEDLVTFQIKDGGSVKISASSVLSLTRVSFPENLAAAHKLAMAAGSEKSKINAAEKALNKIVRDTSNPKPWVREYAQRYIIDMYYAAGKLKETMDATEALSNGFATSRVVLLYRKKIAELAIVNKDSASLTAVKQYMKSNHGKFGTFVALFYDTQNHINNKNFKGAERILRNLLNAHIPKLEKPLNREALELKANVLSSYGRCLVALNKMEEAKTQLVALKTMLSDSDDRVAGLVQALTGEILLAEKKPRLALNDFMQGVVQFANQKDIQARCLVPALSLARDLKLTKMVKDLKRKLETDHPGYKK